MAMNIISHVWMSSLFRLLVIGSLIEVAIFVTTTSEIHPPQTAADLWDAETVPQIDSPLDPESVPWEVHVLFIPTIAGQPQHLGAVRGAGPVDASVSKDIPTPVQGSLLHLGVSPIVPRAGPSPCGRMQIGISGTFGPQAPEGRTFAGHYSASFQREGGYSSGSGSVHASCRSAEASVVHSGLSWGRSGELRYCAFAILIADPPPERSAGRGWAEALARSIARISSEASPPAGRDDRKEILSLAAWSPLPEARTALERLWSRRGAPGPDPSSLIKGSELSDLVGAGLLMLGDAAPLEETELVERLPPDLALRVYLFTPSADIRRVVSGRAAEPLTEWDTAGIGTILDARKEQDSPLARCVAGMREKAWSREMKFYLPCILGGIVVIVVGWLPRCRGSAAGLAHSLIFTGLVLRFITIEAGERLWLPAAGDFFLLAGAVLRPGKTLRIVAAALLACSLTHAIMPAHTPLLFASALLFCLFLAGHSVRLLFEWPPAGVTWTESAALLATGWTLVVPVGCLSATGLILSLRGDFGSVTLFRLQGPWALAYLVAGIAGPLWLVWRGGWRAARTGPDAEPGSLGPLHTP